jgi:hypothetical protein
MGAYGSSYGPVQRSAKKAAASTRLPVEAAFLPSALIMSRTPDWGDRLSV